VIQRNQEEKNDTVGTFYQIGGDDEWEKRGEREIGGQP